MSFILNICVQSWQTFLRKKKIREKKRRGEGEGEKVELEALRNREAISSHETTPLTHQGRSAAWNGSFSAWTTPGTRTVRRRLVGCCVFPASKSPCSACRTPGTSGLELSPSRQRTRSSGPCPSSTTPAPQQESKHEIKRLFNRWL